MSLIALSSVWPYPYSYNTVYYNYKPGYFNMKEGTLLRNVNVLVDCDAFNLSRRWVTVYCNVTVVITMLK